MINTKGWIIVRYDEDGNYFPQGRIENLRYKYYDAYTSRQVHIFDSGTDAANERRNLNFDYPSPITWYEVKRVELEIKILLEL